MEESPDGRRVKYGLADDAFPLSSLPFDISAPILLSLPFKSIICCMCVCKPWRQLLSHPDFVKLHLANSNADPKILIRSHFQSFFSIDYQQPIERGNSQTLLRNFPQYSRQFNTVMNGSCNGLFCVAIRHKKEGPLKIVLWNPSTGDHKILPHTDQSHDSSSYANLLVGLGYEPLSDDYRMVRASFRPGLIQATVYSLKTNSWKVIESPAPSKVGFPVESAGISINGTIYWLLADQRSNKIKKWIVGFHLKDEKFVKLRLVRKTSYNWYDAKILVMEGSVGVYSMNSDVWDGSFIELWMLEQKHRSWINVGTIPLSRISRVVPGKISVRDCKWTPIRVFEDGKVLLYAYNGDKNRTDFMVYDTKANSVIIRLENMLFQGPCNQLVTYTQTLVSPNLHA